MSITCQVCGTINPDGTLYCDGCGVELSGAAQPQSTLPASTASEMHSPAILSAKNSQQSAVELSKDQIPQRQDVQDQVHHADPTVTPAPAALPASGPAKLGVKKFGAPTGDFIPLLGERLVAGRFDASSGPVDIELSGLASEEHISRRHAELYREGEQWYVRDLGSTNGVFVKKASGSFSPRLQEPAPLADGDELALGNLILTFHQG